MVLAYHWQLNGRQRDDGDAASGKALLMRKRLVASKEHVEGVVLGGLQKLTVLEAGPSHIGDGGNVVRA